MQQSDLTSPLKKSKPQGFKCYTIRVLKGQVELIISLKPVRRPTTDSGVLFFLQKSAGFTKQRFLKGTLFDQRIRNVQSVVCQRDEQECSQKQPFTYLHSNAQSFKVIGHCSSDKIFLSSTLSKKERKCIRKTTGPN